MQHRASILLKSEGASESTGLNLMEIPAGIRRCKRDQGKSPDVLFSGFLPLFVGGEKSEKKFVRNCGVVAAY